uniref:ZMY12 protein n=1 Tax=Falco tinnunculus TaxID=100819 RepID=A0A8C4UXX6_FALTI
ASWLFFAGIPQHLAQHLQFTAQEFVLDGKHKEAIPAALHALRFATEVYGSNSVQLVPAYLLLAEASAGVGRLPQASKYLSQAQWIVLRTPDCSVALQCKLHRSLGLFCAAEGDFEQALYHLANDVYLASSTFGLKSIETSGGYFHMANVFFQQNKTDIANSLYAKVEPHKQRGSPRIFHSQGRVAGTYSSGIQASHVKFTVRIKEKSH